MATLEPEDANILEAESINWRRIAYPVVGFIVVLLCGLGIYYYVQSERDQREMAAREATLQAHTPAALQQVADRYPRTTQANFALLTAADLAMAQKDYTGAGQSYRRIAYGSGADPLLRDSAQIGLGSSLEAEDKLDDAIEAYLVVAHRGKSSPYAPFAYTSAARLYEQKHDGANERRVLAEAAGLGGDSPFVKEAGYRLKSLGESSSTSAPAPVQ